MHYLRSFVISLLVLLSMSVSAEPVDINSADATALAAAIDGVGEKKAASIVQYREAYGPFASVDDLAGIKGIGPATVERNRSNIRVLPAQPADGINSQ